MVMASNYKNMQFLHTLQKIRTDQRAQKEKVKQPKEPPPKSWGPEGPLNI